ILSLSELAEQPSASPSDSGSENVSFDFEPPKVTHPPKPQITIPTPASPPPTVVSESGQHSKTEQGFKERRVGRDSGSQKRFPVSFPVSYRTDSGKWVK